MPERFKADLNLLQLCRTVASVRTVGLALCLLPLLVAVLAGCGGRTQAQEPAPAAPQPLPTPVTVEVTRIVMTERLVPVTPTPGPRCAPPPPGSGQPVTVAALLPLGQLPNLQASMGIQTALTLAADSLNAQGGISGHPVRLWFETSGSTAASAQKAVAHAVSGECAVALIASASGEAGTALVEAAHVHNIPLLVVDGSDDAVTASGYAEVFRLAPAAGILTSAYADWLEAVGDYNHDGERRAAFIVEDTAMGRTQGHEYAAALGGRGITADVYAEMVPRNDFSSLIARLVVRELMPDAIFIRINGDSALALQRQLAENGIGPAKDTLIVTSRAALNSESFWQAMGSHGTYAVVNRVGPWHTTVNERGRDFANAFGRYLGRWPESAAFAAYDSLYLLADAAARAGSLESDLLIDALERTDLALASGRYRFPYGSAMPPETHGAAPWAWHQWMDPPVLFLQYTEANQNPEVMAVLWPPTYATSAAPVLGAGAGSE